MESEYLFETRKIFSGFPLLFAGSFFLVPSTMAERPHQDLHDPVSAVRSLAGLYNSTVSSPFQEQNKTDIQSLLVLDNPVFYDSGTKLPFEYENHKVNVQLGQLLDRSKEGRLVSRPSINAEFSLFQK